MAGFLFPVGFNKFYKQPLNNCKKSIFTVILFCQIISLHLTFKNENKKFHGRIGLNSLPGFYSSYPR
jgi:hypothetical protein